MFPLIFSNFRESTQGRKQAAQQVVHFVRWRQADRRLTSDPWQESSSLTSEKLIDDSFILAEEFLAELSAFVSLVVSRGRCFVAASVTLPLIMSVALGPPQVILWACGIAWRGWIARCSGSQVRRVGGSCVVTWWVWTVPSQFPPWVATPRNLWAKTNELR